MATIKRQHINPDKRRLEWEKELNKKKKEFRIKSLRIYKISEKNNKPPREIVLCGNKVNEYKYLFSLDGFIPLFINDNSVPKISLYIKDEEKNIICLVYENESVNPTIKFNYNKEESLITINDIQNKINLLKIDFSNELRISYLDFKPMGYNLKGDDKILFVGNNKIQGNTFNKVNTVIEVS